LPERTAPPDAFGNTARDYEAARPEWPSELVDLVVGDLSLPADAVVLDLAAGTGKLTRALVGRFERVIAVEPDDAMREVLEEVVPRAGAVAGSAESIPLGDDTVDAVFCAEAFHWFASDETVAEIARVLRPRGAFVIFWNIYEGHIEPELPEEVQTLLDESFRRGGTPGQALTLSGEWRRPLERAAFEPLREHELERELVTDKERWISHILSVSSIAALSEQERLELAARLRELSPPGMYRRRLRTLAYWTRLSG
jgi:SAM-dependent methyltransferase